MKKGCLFLLVFVLVLNVGAFAGGTQETTGTSGSTGGDLISTYRPDPNTRYQLTLTVQKGTAVPQNENPKMVKYWEDYFNVDINLIDITGLGGDAGTQKLNLMLTSGDIPDQFYANAQNLQRYYESGLLAEMPDDVMRAYMPTIIKKSEEESHGEAFKYGMFDGKRYGLINGYWWPAQFRGNFILRGDWLNNLGMKVPVTLDDYEKMFYAFTRDDPDGNGKNDTYGLSATMVDQIYGAFGLVKGYWSVVDGKLASDDIQPGIKDALTLLHKWYEDGVLDPEFVTGENQGGYWAITHTFANGRIGSTSMGNVYHWTPPLPGRAEGADYQETSKVGIYDSLVFANPPIGPGGMQASGSEGELISNNFTVFGTQLEKEQPKMGKLFEMAEKMFNGDKDMFLTVFMGVKGEDWKYDANGFPEFIGNTVARDAQAYGAWGTFLFYQFINESKLTDGSVMTWADERNYREGIKSTSVPSFINTPARTQYQAELQKIRDETFVAIITGDQPVSSFDAYVAKWKRSGGDQLTKELNDWYASVQ
jgi:putative aldouronate transport system substrate-binding protein